MVQLGMPTRVQCEWYICGYQRMVHTIENVPGEVHNSKVLPRDDLIGSEECRLIEVLYLSPVMSLWLVDLTAPSCTEWGRAYALGV